jgi:hypothetical protein
MDKITAKILDYFHEVLVELNTPKEMDVSFLESLPESLRSSYIRSYTENPRGDVPPAFLIVEQTEFSACHTSRNNNYLGRWMVRLTSIEVFTGNPNAIEQEINGMYYSHGFGEFSIHDNGEIVRVGWQVGPLFGRGYEYSIVQRGDEIELENQEDLWGS